MPSDELTDRLRRNPVKIECPICRHRQWLGASEGRCDQCGSEIALYADRASAEERLDALVAEGRVAYLHVAPKGLFAVIANRSFRRKTDA